VVLFVLQQRGKFDLTCLITAMKKSILDLETLDLEKAPSSLPPSTPSPPTHLLTAYRVLTQPKTTYNTEQPTCSLLLCYNGLFIYSYYYVWASPCATNKTTPRSWYRAVLSLHTQLTPRKNYLSLRENGTSYLVSLVLSLLPLPMGEHSLSIEGTFCHCLYSFWFAGARVQRGRVLDGDQSLSYPPLRGTRLRQPFVITLPSFVFML